MEYHLFKWTHPTDKYRCIQLVFWVQYMEQIRCVFKEHHFGNLHFHGETAKMSRVMRKPTFTVCENKGAADQRLCFCYIVQSLYFLDLKFQASSHPLWLHSLVCVGSGQETPKTGFLVMWRKYPYLIHCIKSEQQFTAAYLYKQTETNS